LVKGEIFRRGLTGGRDNREATQAYQTACDLGDMQGCFVAGAFLYYTGLSLDEASPLPPEDVPFAHSGRLRRRVKEFASLYAEHGLTRDPIRGKALIAKACAAKVGDACYHLGAIALDEARMEPTDDTAATYLTKGCELGSMDGCLLLGRVYVQGLGVEPDYERAARIFREACDKGDPYNCVMIGRMHEGGAGCERSTERARAYFLKAAAEAGEGFFYLGMSHQKGAPDDGSLQEAATNYQHSCDLDAPGGCFRLGMMRLRGEGGPLDAAVALKLFEQSCEGEVPMGCFLGGKVHEVLLRLATSEAEYFQTHCEDGDDVDCVVYRGLRSTWNLEPDFSEGLRMMREACGYKYDPACGSLRKNWSRLTELHREHNATE
jgi:uncharacterized protein